MTIPAYPLINGHRFDWSSVELNLNGIPYTGVRSITYRESLTPGVVRGTRAQVTGRTRGQYEADGTIEIYKEDFQAIVDALSQAGTRGWMEVTFPIVANYSNGILSVVTDVLAGCRFVTAEDAPGEGGDPAIVSCDLSIMYLTRNGRSALSPEQLLR